MHPLQRDPAQSFPPTAPTQTPSAVEPAVSTSEPQPPAPASLESLLMRFRLITPEQLEEALREKRETGRDVGAIVVERGWVNEDQLTRLLSYAPALGTEIKPADPVPQAYLAPAVEPEPEPKPEFQSISEVEPVSEPEPEPRPEFQFISEVEPVSEPERVSEEPEPVAFASPQPERVSEPEPPLFIEAPPPLSVAPTPEPVVETAPEPATQPDPDPEPVAKPWPEPMAEVAPAPVAEPEPEPEPAVEPGPVSQPEPLAETTPAPQVVRVVEPSPVETIARVFVRLTNGDRVEVGSFDDAAHAKARAEEVVAEIARSEGWPFFSGRFIRPETIVSVDVDATVVRYA